MGKCQCPHGVTSVKSGLCNACATGFGPSPYASSPGNGVPVCDSCAEGYTGTQCSSAACQPCSSSPAACPAQCKPCASQGAYDRFVNCRPCKAGDASCSCGLYKRWDGSKCGACCRPKPSGCTAAASSRVAAGQAGCMVFRRALASRECPALPAARLPPPSLTLQADRCAQCAAMATAAPLAPRSARPNTARSPTLPSPGQKSTATHAPPGGVAALPGLMCPVLQVDSF